jgi:uncharacterized protein YndB with AHSA1/START domain
MNELAPLEPYGVLIAPATLKMERLLPGPIEQIWAYLTESDLRRQWLAAGDMPMKLDASFELVWRNDDLSDPPSKRPEGFSEVQRMGSRITELDPPRRLAISWGNSGDISFDLEPKGKDVLLTVIHRSLPDRAAILMFGAGWHMHLDTLVARTSGNAPEPFWDGWSHLRTEYARRMPA